MSGVAPIEKEKWQWKKTIFFGTLTAIQLLLVCPFSASHITYSSGEQSRAPIVRLH